MLALPCIHSRSTHLAPQKRRQLQEETAQLKAHMHSMLVRSALGPAATAHAGVVGSGSSVVSRTPRTSTRVREHQEHSAIRRARAAAAAAAAARSPLRIGTATSWSDARRSQLDSPPIRGVLSGGGRVSDTGSAQYTSGAASFGHSHQASVSGAPSPSPGPRAGAAGSAMLGLTASRHLPPGDSRTPTHLHSLSGPEIRSPGELRRSQLDSDQHNV